MRYAMSDGKLTEATPTAPRYARCVYCGLPVELSTAPNMETPPLYFHTSDTAAEECEKVRFGAAQLPGMEGAK